MRDQLNGIWLIQVLLTLHKKHRLEYGKNNERGTVEPKSEASEGRKRVGH
jgi:hypothetical protein